MLTLAPVDLVTIFMPILKHTPQNFRAGKIAVACKSKGEFWNLKVVFDNCVPEIIETSLTEEIDKSPKDFFSLEVSTPELLKLEFNEATVISIGGAQDKLLLIYNSVFNLNPSQELLEFRDVFLSALPVLNNFSNVNQMNANLADELAGDRGGWAIFKEYQGVQKKMELFQSSVNFHDLIAFQDGMNIFDLICQIDFGKTFEFESHLSKSLDPIIYGTFSQTTLVEKLHFKVILITSINKECKSIGLIFKPESSSLIQSVKSKYTFSRTDVVTFLASQRNALIISIEIQHSLHFSKLFGESTFRKILCEVHRRFESFLSNKISSSISAIDETRRVYFAIGNINSGNEKSLIDEIVRYAKSWKMMEEHHTESFRIELAVGLASTNEINAANSVDLIHCAEFASEICSNKGTPVHIFSNEDNGSLKEQNLVTRIIAGVHNSAIIPYYQPIYSNSKNDFIAYEALARWRSDKSGLIEADTTQLINALENRGDIHNFTYRFFEIVLSDIDKYDIRYPISVNISPACLKRNDFPDRILEMVIQENISPSMIIFEITESLELSDSETAMKTISQLKHAGFSLFLDDFGTKYSSLSVLAKHPLNAIKIDRSLLQSLGEDKNSNAILAAVREMARSLKLDVVAEGIEDFETAEILKQMGIDLVQGFYYGKPKPPNEVFPLREI